MYLTVDVPDFGKTSLTLGGIVLGYAGAPRVPVAETAAANAKLPFQATLDRVFSQADTLRLICDVARRPDKAGDARSLTPSVELVAESGAVARTVAAAIAQPSGRIESLLTLDGVAPGPYRLRVRVGDGKAVAERELSLIVK